MSGIALAQQHSPEPDANAWRLMGVKKRRVPISRHALASGFVVASRGLTLFSAGPLTIVQQSLIRSHCVSDDLAVKVVDCHAGVDDERLRIDA